MLDRQRLGKQRVEVLQMVKAILGETVGYRNHPCTKMWEPYLEALIEYGMAICREWTGRGYRDSVSLDLYVRRDLKAEVVLPPWLGDERLHSNHRARLLEKDFKFYSKFGWIEKPTSFNYWPKP